MPVDPAPVEDGNIVIVDGVAHVIGPEDVPPPGGEASPRYKSHWQTCPSAAEHRRRGK